MLGKVKSLAQVVKIAAAVRKVGGKVGLITGCFDVVHVGHVDLFRFAKKHCDLVIVGLDSDETVKLNKGPSRPLHTIFQRERVLAELESVDLVFEIKPLLIYENTAAQQEHLRVGRLIKPDCLVTNPLADRFWKEKLVRGKKLGARLLSFNKQPSSSTRIIKFFAGEL